MFLAICGVVVILAWAYVLWGREWLVAKYPARFTRWHLIEDWLWQNSRTKLIAGLYVLGGFVTMAHDALAAAGLDWTPITTQIMNALSFIPADYRPLVLGLWMAVTGAAFTWLRNRTTAPVGADVGSPLPMPLDQPAPGG